MGIIGLHTYLKESPPLRFPATLTFKPYKFIKFRISNQMVEEITKKMRYSENFLYPILFEEIHFLQKKDFFANHLVDYLKSQRRQTSDNKLINDRKKVAGLLQNKRNSNRPPTGSKPKNRRIDLETFRFTHKNIKSFDEQEKAVLKMLTRFLGNRCQLSFVNKSRTFKLSTTTNSPVLSSLLVQQVFKLLNNIFSSLPPPNQLSSYQKEYIANIKKEVQIARYEVALEEDKRNKFTATADVRKQTLAYQANSYSSFLRKYDKPTLVPIQSKEDFFFMVQEPPIYAKPKNKEHEIKQTIISSLKGGAIVCLLIIGLPFVSSFIQQVKIILKEIEAEEKEKKLSHP